LKDLAGKIAFVTGAASGIGLGIATVLAQAGVKVMLCDNQWRH
jgi:NAD(P)-dependent dehydrogenase (short-subunit alcohol dehydrogenase family)